MTLFSAKLKPPITPSQSGSEYGSGRASQPLRSAGHSTMAAPARAISTRTPASRVSGSFSSARASSTAHSGIR